METERVCTYVLNSGARTHVKISKRFDSLEQVLSCAQEFCPQLQIAGQSNGENMNEIMRLSDTEGMLWLNEEACNISVAHSEKKVRNRRIEIAWFFSGLRH